MEEGVVTGVLKEPSKRNKKNGDQFGFRHFKWQYLWDTRWK